MPAESKDVSQGGTLWSRLRKPAISAFIIMFVYATALWLMAPFPARDALLRPLFPYIFYVGMWQQYDAFAPSPRMTNIDITAVVTYADGSTTIWQYPRVETMGFLQRMQKERFRKYGYDYLNWEDYEYLCPDFCRWVARMHNKDGKTPLAVALERHEATIPPPDQGMGKPPPPHDFTFQFFKYEVKPEDLK